MNYSFSKIYQFISTSRSNRRQFKIFISFNKMSTGMTHSMQNSLNYNLSKTIAVKDSKSALFGCEVVCL